MKYAALALFTLLSLSAFSQTTTTLHNLGGKYPQSAYTTSNLVIDTIDGQPAPPNSVLAVGYHLGYIYAGTLRCSGPYTDSPYPVPSKAGFRFTRTFNFTCNGGSSGSSVQESEVYASTCGGRGNHTCYYGESTGGTTTLTK
jgi:hypothetical protein